MSKNSKHDEEGNGITFSKLISKFS